MTERQKSIDRLAHKTVSVLGIPFDEARKRVERCANMSWLPELGNPDSREYQIAVDLIMQIPSDQEVTVEAMTKIADQRKSNP